MKKTLIVQDNIRGATNWLRPDELAYYLSEINLPGKPGEGQHRYQIIGVIRESQMADCHIDMGPVDKFQGVDQLRIITSVITSSDKTEALYTVAEAMDLADEIRGIKVDKSEWPVLDLMKGYQEYCENRRNQIYAS